MSAQISDKLKRDLAAQFKGSRTLEGISKVSYYKVDSDGENHSFRVLPGEFGESKELWFIGVAQHWIKRENSRIPLYCPRLEESPCAFCDKVDEYRELEKELKEQLKSREVKEDKAKYKEIDGKLKVIAKIISYAAPRASYLFNVVDRDGGDVKVFSAPKSIFSKVMGYFSEEGPGIFDLVQGHDFRVKKKKKGRSVEYEVQLAVKPNPVKPTDSGIEDTLKKRYNLEKLVHFDESSKLEEAVEAGIEAILNGVDDNDEDDHDSRGERRGGDDSDSRESRASQEQKEEKEGEEEAPALSNKFRRPPPAAADDEIPMSHKGDREREEPPANVKVDLSSTRSTKSSALLSRMSRLKDEE